MNSIKWLLILVSLSGCASVTPPPYEFLKYAEGNPSPHTKVILIAASNDVANFAEEVIRQKKLWLSRGLDASEVSCYFARPSKVAWQKDHAQFLQLKEDLKSCFLSNPYELKKHTAIISRQKPQRIYLYISGHGSAPAQVRYEHALLADGEKVAKKFLEDIELQKTRPRLAQYYVVAPTPEGPSTLSEDNALTVNELYQALKVFPKNTKKVVVLQGCFTGGFLEQFDDGKSKGFLLDRVANLTVITAAASNRTSFGCGAGSDTTKFGAIYYETLRETPGTLADISWPELYKKLESKTEKEERDGWLSPAERSFPRMGTNVKLAD